jgi:hypothetical protein
LTASSDLFELPLDVLSHVAQVSSGVFDPFERLILTVENLVDSHLWAIFQCHLKELLSVGLLFGLLRLKVIQGHFRRAEVASDNVCGVLYQEGLLEDLLARQTLVIDGIWRQIGCRSYWVRIEITQISRAIDIARKELVKLFLNLREMLQDLILIIVDTAHDGDVCHVDILDLSWWILYGLDLFHSPEDESLFFQ